MNSQITQAQIVRQRANALESQMYDTVKSIIDRSVIYDLVTIDNYIAGLRVMDSDYKHYTDNTYVNWEFINRLRTRIEEKR